MAGCNFYYVRRLLRGSDRQYRVEAGRVAGLLSEKGQAGLSGEELLQLDLSEYKTILRVSLFDAGESCNADYIVENVNGTLYRIEYRASWENSFLTGMNVAFALIFLVTAGAVLFVYQSILLPFWKMQEMPAELAKGNLAVPVKAEKNKMFGRFLWGMDMLRENLEEKKEKELELQKEKQTLILLLSHDIKTPLLAMELYAKALQEGLYPEEEKQKEAYNGIFKNIGEIKNYVNEITNASREDFLHLTVKEGEFYLLAAIDAIDKYYREKLALLHTEFVLERPENCLLKGDLDRMIEVVQNLMENAIKYGDGKRITIYFDEEEDCKLLTVANTGEVPKKEEVTHLFDSFYRGSNSKKAKGSGLGLYIAKKLMTLMDGDVFVTCRDGEFCATVVMRKA